MSSRKWLVWGAGAVLGLGVLVAGLGGEASRDAEYLSLQRSGDIVAVGVPYRPMHWYDNDTIVFRGKTAAQADDSFQASDLYVWRLGQGQPQKYADGLWYKPEPGGTPPHFCAADGRILYATGPTTIDPDTKVSRTPIMAGPIGQEKPKLLTWHDWRQGASGQPRFSHLTGMRCDDIHDPAMGERQWTMNYARTHVLDFGVHTQVRHPDGLEPQGLSGPVVLRKRGEVGGIVVPIDATVIRSPSNAHPLSWEDAFFVWERAKRSRGVDTNPFSTVSYAYVRMDGTVEQFELPVSTQTYASLPIPTRRGLYFASAVRLKEGLFSPDHSGLFAFDKSTKKLRKVLSGRYRPLSVSPDGCKIALEDDPLLDCPCPLLIVTVC